jgi:hypothetical protein
VRLQNRQNASLEFVSPRSITLALRVPGRPDISISLLDAGPPATLADGRVVLPPNREEALVEFELEGLADDKVRVEIFHPDAVEDVTSKVVEGFFDVGRNRRLGKTKGSEGSIPPPSAPAPTQPPPPEQSWADLIADEGHRKALEIIAERRSINEDELEQILGSPHKVRAFSRQFDELMRLLPFGVEVLTVHGMKAYARKDSQ